MPDSLFNEVKLAYVMIIEIKAFQAEMNAIPSPTLVSNYTIWGNEKKQTKQKEGDFEFSS